MTVTPVDSSLTTAAVEPDSHASVGVNIHVRDDSALSVKEHPEEGRVVVRIGDWPASASVFVDVADLDRLIAVLRAARDRMYDAERQGPLPYVLGDAYWADCRRAVLI
jgi:hypothetical protein